MPNTKNTGPLVLKQVNALAATSEVNVLVAYPNDLTGRLIVEALNREKNFRVAAHVSSAGAVMAFAEHLSIQVALVGVSLVTPKDGMDVVHRLQLLKNNCRTIILLNDPDAQVALEAFRAGAKGVFCMSRNGYDVLCECIQSVLDGQIWATARDPNSALRIC